MAVRWDERLVERWADSKDHSLVVSRAEKTGA